MPTQESIRKEVAAWTMHKRQIAPELPDVSLKSFVACQQGVVVQQSSVKPALHLTGIQGMVTHSMASRVDATHVCTCLQGLQHCSVVSATFSASSSDSKRHCI